MTAPKEPRLRCRAAMWGPPRGMRSYQCFNAAKTTALLSGNNGHVETLPVCGTHARHPQWGAYFWNGSKYESPVEEYVR